MNKKIITVILSSLLFISSGTTSFANMKDDNIAFTYAYNNRFNALTELDAKKLHVKDQYGFTLLDYAKISNNQEMVEWIKSKGINSGVDRFLVRRMQIWLYELGLPTDNTLGIYNNKVRDNILHFQKTRGLPKKNTITPDWFYILEEEAVLSIQNKLRVQGFDAPLNGQLDHQTSLAFQDLVKEHSGIVDPLFSIENINYIKGVPKPLYPLKLNTAHVPTIDYLAENEEITSSTFETQSLADLSEKIIGKTAIPVSSEKLIPSTTSIATIVKEKQTDIDANELKEDSKPPIKTSEPAKVITTQPSSIFNYDKNGVQEIIRKARSSKVLEVQARLKIAGFFPHELDGSMGTITQDAIKAYQTSIGHKPSGMLSSSWENPLEKKIIFEIQSKLKALNYYNSDIDGIPGGGTILAMNRYKTDKKINYKGELSTGFLLELFSEKTESLANDVDKTLDGITETAIKGIEVITTTDKTDIVAETIDEPIAESNIQVTFEPNNLPNRTLEQLRLAYIGYFHGIADGKDSDELRAAVSAIQKDKSLPMTGNIDMETRKQIQIETISRFQRDLYSSGKIQDKPTGVLGPKTRRAIAKIKQENRIFVDEKLDIPFMLILIDQVQQSNGLDQYLAFIKEERIDHQSMPIKVKNFVPNSNTEATLDQLKLAYLGYYNDIINGKRDSALTDATKKFQKAYHLSEDGAIGRDTDRILFREAINKFQLYLKNNNYLKDDPTGTLGPKTRQAITKLKKEYNFTTNYEFDVELLLILIDKESDSNFIALYRPYLEKLEKEKAQILDVQKYLIGLNKLSGKADGVIGSATNRAIKAFRTANKLSSNANIDARLIVVLEKSSIKQAQEYLKMLNFNIKADGAWGDNTKKAMNNFLDKMKKPRAEKLNADILISLKNAADKVKPKVVSSPKTTILASSPSTRRAAMPNLRNKGHQISGVLSAAPSRNTVSGRLQLVQNKKGQVTGCKVASVQMDGHWCSGRKSGQQCTVLYKNKRVLSMRCK